MTKTNAELNTAALAIKNANRARKDVREAKSSLKQANDSLKFHKELKASQPTRTDVDAWIAQDEKSIAKYSARLAAAEAVLVEAEKALPPVKATAFDGLLKWFSGASLAKAQDAIQLLELSATQGSWVKGASRSVYSALGKANVAKKTVKVEGGYKAPRPENAVDFAVRYGSFGGLLNLTDAELATLTGKAAEYVADFLPVARLMAKWDATRPVPVFTTMNASPTISAELKRQGAVKVEVAPIKYEERSRVNEKGQTEYFYVAVIVWPEGIKHRTSRYAYGTNNNAQCHACGHAIRNPYNWVPLILTTESGEKRSLWVGRDCAETLFGVQMDGELELAEGQR